MPTYQVDSRASHILVAARSSIHDTNTRWDTISGTVDADPDQLESAGARGTFSVDMTRYDAGDWLKNRKLKKDLEVEAHPTATFEIVQLRDIARQPDGSFQATCDGILRWRGREVRIAVNGSGRLDGTTLDARGSFDLDIRDLGVKPPKILMFKVEEQVTVEVTLKASV